MPNNLPGNDKPAEQDWQPIETAPEGEVVLTKIDDKDGVRNEQPLKRQGRLWFFADSSMYVYYQPTHWRALEASVNNLEKLLESVAREVAGPCRKHPDSNPRICHCVNCDLTEAYSTVLRRKLLPLLQAGEAMRDSGMQWGNTAPTKWDAALKAALEGK